VRMTELRSKGNIGCGKYVGVRKYRGAEAECRKCRSLEKCGMRKEEMEE
jgi:hypothetical protein